ncbi:hypothetical protein [Coleofasciculus chthonoplastes]|jgi:hypothetical protein|uniref:hypothetical protein n=1 Tax=Coleofasciculus chthonoplastes TaxID=64178 RepID=UPI0032FAD818
MMHYPNYTTESPERFPHSTNALHQERLDENLQDVSLTNLESIPFFEFIPATPKSPPGVLRIAGVVILLVVLGISGAIALSSWTRGNGSVLSLVNSPQTLTKDK